MPQTALNPKDPRVKRTRRLLQVGLRSLLKTKTFDEIVVQDIADTATVNRATFYGHYSDKLSLFNDLVATDFKESLDRGRLCLDRLDEASLTALAVAVAEFLEAMHRDHVDCTTPLSSGPLIDAALILAIRNVVLQGLAKNTGGSSRKLAVISATVSGAIYHGVKERLSQRNLQVKGTDVKLVVRLVLPMLASE